LNHGVAIGRKTMHNGMHTGAIMRGVRAWTALSLSQAAD